MPKSFEGVLHEWGAGKLHSGSTGKVVTSQAQALAIAFSEQRRKMAGKMKKKKK